MIISAFHVLDHKVLFLTCIFLGSFLSFHIFLSFSLLIMSTRSYPLLKALHVEVSIARSPDIVSPFTAKICSFNFLVEVLVKLLHRLSVVVLLFSCAYQLCYTVRVRSWIYTPHVVIATQTTYCSNAP